MSLNKLILDNLSPREIVAELDKYIVGQDKAKKAVAIALRNRVRRKMLPAELQDEVAPKNIIMIGPTGVGKTEIARRLSKLSGAPFVKVEATKYTEVGYVGRDVESMIRDLMHVGINLVRSEMQEGIRPQAEERTEELLLDLLLPGSRSGEQGGGDQFGAPNSGGQNPSPVIGGNLGPGGPNFLGINLAEMQNTILKKLGTQGQNPAGFSTNPTPGQNQPQNQGQETNAAAFQKASGPSEEEKENFKKAREQMRKKLKAGQLEDKEVEVLVSQNGGPSIEIFSGNNLEDIDLNLGNLGNIFGNRKKVKRLPIKSARQVILNEEIQKLLDNDRVAELARERVQEMGIVFIDEIDKIANRSSKGSGPDVSREGVQRDILPIVEGSQVNTKYGLVDTRHILFIAAGAFHISKPSDLIPELQGRFPIRVELESLGQEDFFSILTQPANAITRQYIELLKTEGVEIEFQEDALRYIAKIAAEVNGGTENIGARRLHTIMEILLEEVSFHASDMKGQKIVINPAYVEQRLGAVAKDQDLSRYIL